MSDPNSDPNSAAWPETCDCDLSIKVPPHFVNSSCSPPHQSHDWLVLAHHPRRAIDCWTYTPAPNSQRNGDWWPDQGHWPGIGPSERRWFWICSISASLLPLNNSISAFAANSKEGGASAISINLVESCCSVVMHLVKTRLV